MDLAQLLYAAVAEARDGGVEIEVYEEYEDPTGSCITLGAIITPDRGPMEFDAPPEWKVPWGRRIVRIIDDDDERGGQ